MIPAPEPGPGGSPASAPARIEALREALRGPLPGLAAQKAAWPHPRRTFDPADEVHFGPAAVLIALCPAPAGAADSGEVARFRIPLIRRRADMRHHAGQISLPGGECAPEESFPDCALREAEEEIGLPASSVDVLGLLTPVPVPVSRYRIQPVVGWVPAAPPAWVHQIEEVDAVLTADPDRLLAEGLRGIVRRDRDGIFVDAPAFVVPDEAGDALVWGATAIILSEFLAVWAQVR